jgi:SAM domain (Sterile alpha motif)
VQTCRFTATFGSAAPDKRFHLEACRAELGRHMEIGDWLRSLGLEQYEAAFRENAIDDAVPPSVRQRT